MLGLEINIFKKILEYTDYCLSLIDYCYILLNTVKCAKLNVDERPFLGCKEILFYLLFEASLGGVMINFCILSHVNVIIYYKEKIE